MPPRAASKRGTQRSMPRLLKRSKIPHWVEFGVLGLVALVLFIVGAGIVWASFVPIPSISDFRNREVSQSTKIYDRTGNIVLYDVHGAEQRTSVPLTAISPYIQEASIAIEDPTFYQNAGFRPVSFLRALLADLLKGSYAQGGSTITQQVVKNALLSQSKTITRKLEEIILALRLTKVYTKDQILNTYLNESPYGGTIYGVEAASQYFFGVGANSVDLAQAAYIAGLPQAPTYYSPYGDHRAALDARKNTILLKMKALGYITTDEYTAAVAEKVQFKTEGENGIKAPWFVFYIREYLEQKYGVDAVNNGGLRVITTLDNDLEQQAENIITTDAPGMAKNFNASNTGVVVIDPKTGQILAMVGSSDYFNNAIQGQVNVALASRQPGSSFKPFVYVTAFEKGYTPDTVVFDLQTQFSTACSPQDVTNNTSPCYSPQNYDGIFHGPLTLRNAIAISDNVASIKTLYLAGIQSSLDTAKSLGITTLGDPSQYGLTLVLGGGEVNLLQMTSAYGVFANDGVKNPPTGILKVLDGSGTVLEEYQSQPTRVLDPQIAREINNVLSDNVARSPEFGSNSPLQFSGYTVADKTGTTDNSRDAWVIGYTPSIVVGEWAGNNDNTPMVKKIAAFIVAPTWHKILSYALQKYSSTSDTFPDPAPNPNADSLPPVLTGNWNTDPSRGVHDILYWVKKDNPLITATNPARDPQFAYWEYPVELWSQTGQTGSTSTTGILPTTPETGGTSPFSITSPQTGTTVSSNTPFIVTSSGSSNTIISISYSLNGVPIGTAVTPPFRISVLSQTHGPALLSGIALMKDGSTETKGINITVQ